MVDSELKLKTDQQKVTSLYYRCGWTPMRLTEVRPGHQFTISGLDGSNELRLDREAAVALQHLLTVALATLPSTDGDTGDRRR